MQCALSPRVRQAVGDDTPVAIQDRRTRGGDDVACLTPPPGQDIVLTADALVAGIHFFADDPADALRHRRKAVEGLLRAVHSVKGGAGFFGSSGLSAATVDSSSSSGSHELIFSTRLESLKSLLY